MTTRKWQAWTILALVGLGAGWLMVPGADSGWVAANGLEQAAPPGLVYNKAEASAKAVIVLKDGTELTGEIIEETDDAVVIKSAFGKSTIKRARIKEIKRGENPLREQFEDRFERASRRKDTSKLFELADWALDSNLLVEHKRALKKIIELEPDHEKARSALGHARLDGEWIEQARVQELVQQGYILEGLDLVKRKPGAPGVGKGDDAGSEKGATGVANRPKRVRPELSDADKAKRERERAKRRKEAEKFRKKKEREYIGVPWEDAWEIKTPRFLIRCNSTKEVARTYQWIMENLYAELSNRFRQSHKRKSGRLVVFVHRNHEEFMATYGMGPGTGGFYRLDNERVHCYHGTFGLTSTTYNVLAHEGTHQFQGRVLGNLRNLPSWIIEGLAVYFGDGSKLDYRKKKIVSGLIPRDRLLHIQEKMRAKRHEPLRTLIALPQNRFGGSQYADGWSLVYFLFGDAKAGREMIGKYWLAGTERRVTTRDFEQLAEKYYGSMEELEEKWVASTLALKPDPAGYIEEDAYISDDFKFEARLPASDWVFLATPKDDRVLAAMELPDTDAAVDIRFLNKPDQLTQGAFIEAYEKRLEARYSEVKRKVGTVNGVSGYILDFTDKKPKADDEDDEDDEKKADKPKKDKPVDAVKKKPRRYRSYVIVGVSKAYEVRGSALEENFEIYEADFEAAAENFELVLGNRW